MSREKFMQLFDDELKGWINELYSTGRYTPFITNIFVDKVLKRMTYGEVHDIFTEYNVDKIYTYDVALIAVSNKLFHNVREQYCNLWYTDSAYGMCQVYKLHVTQGMSVVQQTNLVNKFLGTLHNTQHVKNGLYKILKSKQYENIGYYVNNKTGDITKVVHGDKNTILEVTPVTGFVEQLVYNNTDVYTLELLSLEAAITKSKRILSTKVDNLTLQIARLQKLIPTTEWEL